MMIGEVVDLYAMMTLLLVVVRQLASVAAHWLMSLSSFTWYKNGTMTLFQPGRPRSAYMVIRSANQVMFLISCSFSLR